jgi:hypothetical protein
VLCRTRLDSACGGGGSGELAVEDGGSVVIDGSLGQQVAQQGAWGALLVRDPSAGTVAWHVVWQGHVLCRAGGAAGGIQYSTGRGTPWSMWAWHGTGVGGSCLVGGHTDAL